MITCLKKVDHIGFVVKDVEKVKEYYSSVLGVGLWRVREVQGIAGVKRGKPIGDHRFKVAIAEVGETRIELIEPIEGDTVWQEFLDSKGEGIHHVSFGQVDNYREEIEKWKKHGIEVLQEDRMYVYMDTTEDIGMVIEFNPKREPQKP